MLGRWLKAVRVAWAKGNLPEQKSSALEKLGVAMESQNKSEKGAKGGEVKEQVRNDRFDEFAAALTHYKNEKGNVELSRTVEYSGLKLGAWVMSHLVKARRGDLPGS
jgi:hypothetical protein